MEEVIPSHLEATIRLVPLKSWRSTEDIFNGLPDKRFISRNATANRLNALFHRKLVEFERRGKQKFWRRVK